MASDQLSIQSDLSLGPSRMVLGFSGWMDGGEVSTGTVQTLIDRLSARLLAEIAPEDFYIFSFPGSMELAAMFRPHIKIEDGLVTEMEAPSSRFFVSESDRLILLQGKEPHLRWSDYADCVFDLARRFQVATIYFIGSVAGLVPHTREPRLYASASEEGLKPMLARMGARFSNYEGPGSFSTYLTRRAPGHGVQMINLVAEIPAYVQGRNVRCIKAVSQRLAAILDLQIALDDMRVLADQLEEHLNKAITDQPELKQRIAKLEADYDNEVFEQMGELKDWLQQQGIRLD